MDILTIQYDNLITVNLFYKDQIPALNGMSNASFRTSFLRRAGVLGTERGAWWLHVSSEPHDIVLERFGWTWEWIKLPWMDDLLRVEW